MSFGILQLRIVLKSHIAQGLFHRQSLYIIAILTSRTNLFLEILFNMTNNTAENKRKSPLTPERQGFHKKSRPDTLGKKVRFEVPDEEESIEPVINVRVSPGERRSGIRRPIRMAPSPTSGTSDQDDLLEAELKQELAALVSEHAKPNEDTRKGGIKSEHDVHLRHAGKFPKRSWTAEASLCFPYTRNSPKSDQIN